MKITLYHIMLITCFNYHVTGPYVVLTEYLELPNESINNKIEHNETSTTVYIMNNKVSSMFKNQSWSISNNNFIIPTCLEDKVNVINKNKKSTILGEKLGRLSGRLLVGLKVKARRI
ncbi:hypothetical protein D929_00106 [Enterococcus faecalis 02-MB-P-10]|uniref:hypothetical protein n=1 Tax=Enterococcus faecalis TaxID=1351 RepID=UPI000353A782|nr:hypothetical protein [Enterococcus faecalis]EPH77376.1 hypothetical protein D929_00106 [Enterococcus faecalis 02-MB-P-10]